MEPENLKFGGGIAESTMHPAVLAAMIIAVLLILLLPRKRVLVPVLLMAFLIPLAQQFYVAGLHLFVLRIVILAALVRALSSRLFSKQRFFAAGMGAFDWVFLLWTFFHVVSFLVLFSFQPAAITNQLGFVWDTIGVFLVLRFFIQDQEDMDRVLRTFALIAAVLAACMLNEHLHMQNVFGYLGAMRLVPETRDGMVRAQAAFSHPLLAGTFGAALLPLFFLMWHNGKSKTSALVGIVASTIMTICASSSTPFLTYAAGIGALCLWPLRGNMRLIRWGLVIGLVALNFIMKAPVWFVISHISLFGSSSSDHRAYLVDAFIRHFNDWWLVGTNDAGNWGWGMWDTSNQYINEGEGGGLATFICFIALISISFGNIGKARKAVEGDRAREWSFWFLGAALFANVVGFFGVSYFDQTRVMWFTLLVMIAAATSSVLGVKAASDEPVAETALELPLVPVSRKVTREVAPLKRARPFKAVSS